MGFKTYTCVICGKEGITKPNSYAYGNGRACRCHEEVQEDFNKREEAKKTLWEEKVKEGNKPRWKLHKESSEDFTFREIQTEFNVISWPTQPDLDPEVNFMLNISKFVDLMPFYSKATKLIFDKGRELMDDHKCPLMYYFNSFMSILKKWGEKDNPEGTYFEFKFDVEKLVKKYITTIQITEMLDEETFIRNYKQAFDRAFVEIDTLNKKLLVEKTDENFLAIKKKLVNLSKYLSIFNGTKFAKSETVKTTLHDRFEKLEKLLLSASGVEINKKVI